MNERFGEIGVIGLGPMGGALARNLARRGMRVVGTDRDPWVGRRLRSAHPEARLELADDPAELVAALARPRCILIMVPAGAPVDAVLDALDGHLEPGDVVIDGGNSEPGDTDRRFDRAATRAWHFVGMGVSGGPAGALEGPSLMVGCAPATWRRLRPLLESIAALGEAGRSVGWCGPGSSGHFVKMVHNGIEYAEIQHIAEVVLLLRRAHGRPIEHVAKLFERWGEGELESHLVEITAEILRTPDPRHPDTPLLDAVLDRAEQHGTGRWSAETALDLGVAAPSIVAAVDARVLSARLPLRRRGAKLLGRGSPGGLEGPSDDDLASALLGARIASYTQGFELLAAGSEEAGYATDLAEVARIWQAGCIIRARLLESAHSVLARGDGPLAFEPPFDAMLSASMPGWRRVVGTAAVAGVPAPGLMSSLSWLDTLTTERGSANLIQALRARFGGHDYERVDDPGAPFEAAGSETRSVAGARQASSEHRL